MNTLKTLSTLILMFGTNLAVANAEPACATCSTLDQWTVKLKNKAPGAIDSAKRAMEDVKFSKDPALAKLEAVAFVRLTLVALKADDMGEASDIFYTAHLEHAQLLDEAVRNFSPAEQTTLKKARAYSKQIFEKGNG